MVKISTICKADPRSKSMRVTIPKEIVNELNLSIGDTLKWEIIEIQGKKGAFIRKIE